MQIEVESYEPIRRDSRTFLAEIVARPRSVCLVALANEQVMGFCFGAALESFPQVGGTQSDPSWGKENTVYAADLTVNPAFRAQGVATKLKSAQLHYARELGYVDLAGRNRVGLAQHMWHINQRLGAYQVQYLKNEYDDDLEPKDCIYYHIDLRSLESSN